MKDCIILKNRTHRSSEITTPLEAKYSHRPKRNRHTVRAKFADWGLEDPSGKADEAFLETIRIIEEKVLDLRRRLQEEA